jgi:ADP-heptose:LPS heptosyltransferase
MSEAIGDEAAVVVLRALALGDLLTAVPALRGIHAAFPGYTRYLTSPAWLRPLVEHLDLADVCLSCAPGSDGGLWLTNDLEDRIPLERAQLNGLVGAPSNPDVAVNLRGVREATHLALLRLAPRRFIGFANPAVPASAGGPAWDPDEHEVSRWCRLLASSGVPTDPTDLHVSAPQTIISRCLHGCSIVHPGAGSPARQWPRSRWATVARWLRERGDRVVITGSAGEFATADQVAASAGIPGDDVLAGRLTAVEMLSVVGAARLLASSDTGVAHMAYAVRTPSVTLFGPTPPSLWGPPPDPRHRVVWAGARGDPYAIKPDPTILAISVDEVLDELARYLGGDVDAQAHPAGARAQ